jgi:tetratricopeptide (TPR) repeat protein
MNLRPKAKRRIAFLAAVSLAVVMAGVLALHLAGKHADRRLEAERADAMAAYQTGDYAGALDRLGHYLEKAKDTDQVNTPPYFRAMLAYGKCRMSVRMNRADNLVEAKTIFQNYLTLCPDDLDAQHALLNLYPQIDYQQEELALADSVLAKHPDDQQALMARIQALLGESRPAYADALKTCDQLNLKYPLDVHGQLLGMEIRLRMHVAPADLVARALSLQKAHDGDPRFELLLASTYLGVSRAPASGGGRLIASPATAPSTAPSDVAELPDTTPSDRAAEWNGLGRHWLQVAADRPAPDADFVLAFVGTLDLNNMYPQSLALLQKDAPALHDPALSAVLVQRLWEAGYFRDVVDSTAGLDPKHPGPDVSSLALRASALYELAGPHGPGAGEAAAIVSALASRKADPSAVAWAAVLSAHYAAAPIEPRTLVNQYQAALAQDPDNAVTYLLTGDAYALLGENEAAASMWESASWHAPEWGLPYARIARLRLSQGRSEEALSRARAAVVRSPQSPDARATAVLAWHAVLKGTPHDGANAASWDRLLQEVQAIQTQWPRDAETLPLYVTLLAESGRRDQALGVLKDAASVTPPPAATTLLALDEVNKTERLGFAGDLVERISSSDANSIVLAMRHANDLFNAGEAAQGLALLKAAQKAANGDNDPKWRLAVASYLERSGDSGALAAWVDLGDKDPNDRLIQSAVLQSSTRFLDRDFWKRSIDRLHNLTGDNGQMWRLERCRWLLVGVESGATAGSEQAEKDRSEAVTILTELTRQFPNESEPHRMLGLAFERDQKLDRAADELGIAIALQPADVESALDLFRVDQEWGKRSDAQAVLDRIARRPDLSAESRRLLALAYEQEGRPQRAIELLTAGAADLPATRPSTSMGDVAAAADRNGILARLYARVGRYDQAEALYSSLLDLPSTTPRELADGAQFFASRGKLERASEFHTRLAGMNLPPGAMPDIIGRFQEQFGSAADALASFRQATNEAPASPRVWRELASFQLRHGRFSDAAAAVDQGLKAAGADTMLSALAQDIKLLRSCKTPADARLVMLALARDPSDAAAIELLKAMLASQERNETLAQKVVRLKAVSEHYPEFLPAQERLIAAYLDQRQYQSAADAAAAAVRANPYDPDAARLATGVFMAWGQMTRMLDAATTWRQRSGADTVDADLAIADALIALDRPREAVDCLAPYFKGGPSTLPAAPGGAAASLNLLLYRGYAHALIAAGRPADAAALFQPLLATNADARQAWMSLATSQKSADAATAWLDQVAPLIADNASEPIALAEAWLAVGSAFHSNLALHKAHDLLAPAAARQDADSHVLALAAQVAQELGDYESAETLWRRLIQEASAQVVPSAADPVRAEICNNLAYVLMASGDASKLPEARQLAEQAVAASPDTSSFYDTLARIYSHQGKRDLAVKAFRTAREKDPNNVEAMFKHNAVSLVSPLPQLRHRTQSPV